MWAGGGGKCLYIIICAYSLSEVDLCDIQKQVRLELTAEAKSIQVNKQFSTTSCEFITKS